MRKVIVIAFLFSYCLNAQEHVDTLKITPNGINGYIVKEDNNLSKQKIYNNLQRWAEYNINNAEFSKKSEIENEYLEYKIFINRALTTKDGVGTFSWHLSFNIEYRIKDGKARMDIVNLSMPFDRTTGNGSGLRLVSNKWTMSFFDKKGKSREPELRLREQMNEWLKLLTINFFNAVQGKIDNSKSDW